MADFSGYVSDAFGALTPDINGIYNQASTYSMDGWLALQKTLVIGSGAAAVAIPVLHFATIAADVAFLMNRMAVCSYGVGAIIGKTNGYGNFLEEEDFAVVLSRWAGASDEEELGSAAIAKVAADLTTKVGSKAASKILAKTMVQHCGILIGKKLAGKVGVKLGAKVGAKLGGKLVAGIIPFLGPAVGGGINYYFISKITTEAKEWYGLKCI